MIPATGAGDVPSAPNRGPGVLPLPEPFPAADTHRYGADNLFGTVAPREPVSTRAEPPAITSSTPESPTFAPVTGGADRGPRVDDAVVPITDQYTAQDFRNQAPQPGSFSGYPQQPGVYAPYQDRGQLPPGSGHQGYYATPHDRAYPPAAPGMQAWPYQTGVPADMSEQARGPTAPYGYPQTPQAPPPRQQQSIWPPEQTLNTGSAEAVRAESLNDLFRPAD